MKFAAPTPVRLCPSDSHDNNGPIRASIKTWAASAGHFQNVRLSNDCGLGGALHENAQNMLGSLGNRKAGHFIESIAARTAPPYDLGMDINGLSKGLVALCVVGIDDLPRRQHEHGRMERVGSEQGFQLDVRQRRSLVKHAQRIDQPAIKEDPLGSARLMEVLFNVSTQNLLSALRAFTASAAQG